MRALPNTLSIHLTSNHYSALANMAVKTQHNKPLRISTDFMVLDLRQYPWLRDMTALTMPFFVSAPLFGAIQLANSAGVLRERNLLIR